MPDESDATYAERPSFVPRAEKLVGHVLENRYRLIEPIGEGGFGYVFRAQHLTLGRDVAVKVLRNESADEVATARFKREGATLAALSHPHIVTVTDFGVSDEGFPFLVMELIEGRTLREVMDREELTAERAVRIELQILKALAYAHERGIVHRDLKPGNVLLQRLGDEDHVKLLDFGFAKFFGARESKHGPALTESGMAFGTPGYIAPEQLSSLPNDGRVDLYAAAVILFELFARRRPFHNATASEELRDTLLNEAPLLSSVCPEEPASRTLDPIIAKALSKDPAARFASAGEMIRQLEIVAPSRTSIVPAIASPRAPEARPPSVKRKPWLGLFALAGTALSALVIVASVLLRPRQASEPMAPPEIPEPELVEPEMVDVLLGPPVGDRPPPRDPWSGEIPPELAQIREQLGRGDGLTASDRRELMRRAREQPWDPKPFLLLAWNDREQNSLTGAVQRYERAYRASPSSRGDERMLRDLIIIASHPSTSARATEAIETIYGSEALPALDAAIEVARVRPRIRALLEDVRARAASSHP